jgi:hypothetical protein
MEHSADRRCDPSDGHRVRNTLLLTSVRSYLAQA